MSYKRKADCTPEEWEVIRVKRREITKRYEEKHKEEIKIRKKIYRQTHREEIKQKNAIYREKNREACRARSREWDEKNKEKRHEYYIKNKEKLLKQNKELRQKNKQKYAITRKKYYEEHKDELKKYRHERYLKRKQNITESEKEILRGYCKKYHYRHREKRLEYFKKINKTTKLKYDDYVDRLSVDEAPIQDADGYLLVKDFHDGQYFYPTRQAVRMRIEALEGKRGNSECHLYASDDSKKRCPVYRSHIPKDGIIRSERVNGFWRELIISRANGVCERCGKPSEVLHAHHIAPKAVCAFDGDIDNGMALCPECHKEVHSTDGCRLHELAAEKREAV